MRKDIKNYVKNHISIDVGSRLILYFIVQRGPRFDTCFAIVAMRNMGKYNLKYVLADGAWIHNPSENA